MATPSDNQPVNFMQKTGLFIAKFCTSAWVGAAVLFVIVGILEVTRGGFDSATKDSLVVIRFPAFYIFGFTLVAAAWIGVFIAGCTNDVCAKKRGILLGLLSLVLTLMLVDYIWIYGPLAQMVTPPGQSKPAHFTTYHEASKWINLAGLFVCSLAVWLLNWPTKVLSCSASDKLVQIETA